MARINEILEKLNDNAPTVVDIPGNGEENFRCKALFIKKESPTLELVFPPQSWEADELKMGEDCNLAIEHNGLTINLIARLDGVAGERRLRFTAREPVSPESLREFFRVSISIPVEASYVAGSKETKARTWKMSGTTLDLSGSGLLALFTEKPPCNHHIQLVLTIPNEKTPVVCLANVVRSYRIRKNRFQVAFHFDNISPKSRDAVISCCLQEQRRQLRDNVQTL